MTRTHTFDRRRLLRAAGATIASPMIASPPPARAAAASLPTAKRLVCAGTNFCICLYLVFAATTTLSFAEQPTPLSDRLISSEEETREAAIKELAQLDADARKGAILALANVLKNKRGAFTNVHLYAVTALDSIVPSDPNALAGLAEALNDREKASVRSLAAEVFKKIDHHEAVPSLLGLISEDSDRRRACKALHEIARLHPEIVRKWLPELVMTLKHYEGKGDGSLWPHYYTGYVLRNVGPANAEDIPAFVDLLKHESMPVRKAAAEVLGRTVEEATAGAVTGLGLALGDDDFQVRIAAASALGNLGAKAGAAVPALAGALEDKLLSVRYHAKSALGKIGTPEARAALAAHAGSGEKDAPPSPKTTGYSCLFMGHSIFVPTGTYWLDGHPQRAGFPLHRQRTVFHGSHKGTPKKLWVSTENDLIEAKELLATGTVDLVGLTWFYNHDDVADYKKWVDLALEHNPNTRFIIHSPWANSLDENLEEHKASLRGYINPAVESIIKDLRKAYPKNEFHRVPMGEMMLALWELYNEGGLPEITHVQRTRGGDKATCLYSDGGHGGAIPCRLGELMWLAVIYQVDLEEYDWDTGTKADLKELAYQVLLNDPYSGVKRSQ